MGLTIDNVYGRFFDVDVGLVLDVDLDVDDPMGCELSQTRHPSSKGCC